MAAGGVTRLDNAGHRCSIILEWTETTILFNIWTYMGCLDCIALEAIGRLHLALGTTEFLCLWTYVEDVILHRVTMVLRGLQVLTAGLGDGIKVDTAFFNIQLSAMEKSQRWKLRAFGVLLFLFVLHPTSCKPIEETLCRQVVWYQSIIFFLLCFWWYEDEGSIFLYVPIWMWERPHIATSNVIVWIVEDWDPLQVRSVK